jgi:glutamate carboxypeptidase
VAHAALDPEFGVSAIDELVDQLLRIREFIAAPELQPVLCNVGTVTGGTRANVVPDAASAEIGLRFVDAESERRVLDWLFAREPVRAGATVTAVRLSHRPAWQPSTADEELLEQVRAAASATGKRIDARPAAGAGDTNLIGSLGTPTLDGFGPAGGGAHAVDEHVRIDSFGERIELLTALIRVGLQRSDAAAGKESVTLARDTIRIIED